MMTMMTTRTAPVPRLDIDPALAPDEITLVSLLDRDQPSWLVQRYAAFITTPCDVCHELMGRRENVYFESDRTYPVHVACWLTQLTARPVRVIRVRYRGLEAEVDDGAEDG